MRAIVPDPRSNAFYRRDPHFWRCPLCSPAHARLKAARQFLRGLESRASTLPKPIQVISRSTTPEQLLTEAPFIQWYHAPWEDAPGWETKESCPEFGRSPFFSPPPEEPIYLRKETRSLPLQDPDRLIEGLNLLLKRILNALPFHGLADSTAVPAAELRRRSVEGARAVRMAIQWLYEGPREVWEVVLEYFHPCQIHMADFIHHWLSAPAERGRPRKAKEERRGLLQKEDVSRRGRGGRSKGQADKLRTSDHDSGEPIRRFRGNPLQPEGESGS